MNAHLIFIFFLSSLLQDGLTQRVYYGPEGESITVRCSFKFPGGTKLFCRKSCEDGDVLIKTKDVTAQRDRYSIRYEGGNFFSQLRTFVHVTIKQLRKSDSGRYMCRLKRPFHPDLETIVKIIVTDALPSSTPNWSVEPTPTSLPAAIATAPSSSSPETSELPQSSALQITALVLNVSFIIIIIITLTVTVMVFCRIRTSKHTVAG
ncbi:natural cytotoxicity triggering receptor 2-like [Limanda limanda]|uniref:natural cytotoxicity triggering receptor 2-like n=1 Tax=Limanda limanda TaxID=27771 RepID=UPI0029C7BD14|nr:natural cytotoxicity triggering receptor 2-like [Limanda limanda]